MYQYRSIEQCYLDVTIKYVKRAIDYLDNGKYHHASGCLAKASKKLYRYEQYKGFTEIDKLFQPMIDKLANNVAENIIRGNNESNQTKD